MKKSCVIYDSWKILLCNLSDEMAGALIKMILEYALDGGTNANSDESVNAMFAMIKEKLDEDAEAWEREKARRSEAGKKGMKIRWHSGDIAEDNTDIRNDNSAMEAITPITDSVSVSVSVKDKKKNTKKKSRSNIHDFSERKVDYDSLEEEVQEHKLS